ncbi:TerB family tellurite resistance protein [Thiohalomonas denitrificans]|uniref:tellurite resistance TerB family protein n=1 Tax=Thiohalomonas denitrificans TaxID=415747 RepID=UPI0026F133D8|nr:TerB family tellurite resistance protein [Thiohalomonas denitrificans]
MLSQLREFFERNLSPPREVEGSDEHAVRLATAALLFEMARQDETVRPEELDVIADAVQRKFELPKTETEELMALAAEEVRESTDYYQFTSLINERFSPGQKVRVVEHLWEVAWADGKVDRYEEHMVRKIAELLYVPHKDFIAAKLRTADNQ